MIQQYISKLRIERWFLIYAKVELNLKQEKWESGKELPYTSPGCRYLVCIAPTVFSLQFLLHSFIISWVVGIYFQSVQVEQPLTIYFIMYYEDDCLR